MSDEPLRMHPFESAIVRTLEADNARLTAENERLRAALEKIEYMDRPQSRGFPRRVSIQEIARAALSPPQESNDE